MIFEKTSINGVYNISIEKKEDDRGFFTRIIDIKEFEEKGIKSQYVQSSISKSLKKGTLRGMHFQIHPNLERSEEHTSELHSQSHIAYAVFCLDRKSVV